MIHCFVLTLMVAAPSTISKLRWLFRFVYILRLLGLLALLARLFLWFILARRTCYIFHSCPVCGFVCPEDP